MPNRSTTVLAVARLFFPRTPSIGVEPDCPFSPGLLKKIAYAGAQSSSFRQATKDLAMLAEVEVTAQRVERWTKRVGEERVAQVEASAAA